ncbi:patatin [Paenibacillus pectinilyticus]|uniref:Patatin n=1 Tax=Paenibacillus pectinilyticus TaxID=512399 RepID=A0A1C1A3A8_9BACL|nr:patatin-like phospholipase family protein [Paenibacillus pectinilyticus]OCT15042.1 patatin [Paenibacillus pectinilyticus]
MYNEKHETRAVVLGGGGVTGIAWEIGMLTGLLHAGINLADADAIIGTSAGSFVGAALACQYDLTKLYESQLVPNTAEVNVSTDILTKFLWIRAVLLGGSNPKKIGKMFGDIAKKHPSKVTQEIRQSVVKSRLVTTEWPSNLNVTAINAATGDLHILNKDSGISLLEAVSASGAVPGIWPFISFGGQDWIDGGMVSSTNAHLASGFNKVIVLSPMPKRHGFVPGVKNDVAELQKSAKASLIIPDGNSIVAMGKNRYDPSYAPSSVKAGYEQAIQEASSIREIWE